MRWRTVDNNNIDPLGFLPGGTQSEARAVSDDGSVIVGNGNTPTSGLVVFRWTEAGGMESISDEPAKSFGISGDGTFVVGMLFISADPYIQEAFRWSESTGLVSIGELPGGSTSAVAFDVSLDGSIIVGRGNTELGYEAFIWDQSNGMRNLREALANDYGLNLTGWVLEEATAVSDDGRTICGYGINPDGAREAWVAHLGDVAPCSADIDASGAVDVTDLLAVLAAWGACAACPEDVNDNGAVDVNDLLAVLSAWGACPS